MAGQKSKLFYNGRIITLDPKQPPVEAMLVREGRISGLGKKEDFILDNSCRLIDLKGLTVLPGFNDSHLHLLGIGEAMETVDLTAVKSLKELQGELNQFISEKGVKQGSWITGRGWNQNNYPGKELPDRQLLDKCSPANPVFLKRACGHLGVANSIALKKAGISKNTPDPAGGRIDRDKLTGEPNGILRENAMAFVDKLLPEPGLSDYQRIIKNAADRMVKSGLTSVQTDDFGNWEKFRLVYKAYQKLKEKGNLPLRINLQIRMGQIEDFRRVVETGLNTGTGNDDLEIGPCKILADGSMGGRTAALSSPYADKPDTAGVLLYEERELREFVNLAYKSGFQLAIHGIGDRAIEIIVNLYRQILKREAEMRAVSIKEAARQLRPRIIHSQLTNNFLIKEIAELGIALDVQPIFINSDLHIAEERLGSSRLEGTYAWKSMLDHGINLGGGSDGPVESFSPLKGIYSAVTRKDLKGFPPGGWRTEEALKTIEAIKLFTYGSAYNSFNEKKKGSLQTGKLADFVILDQNITTIEPDKIKDIEVLATYIGGEEVFSNIN